MTETRTEPTFRPKPRATSDYEGPDSGFGRQADQWPTMPGNRRQRRRVAFVVALLVICVLAAVASILLYPRTGSTLPGLTPRAEAPPPARPEPPKARYPIDAPMVSMPPLDASDATIVAAMPGVIGSGVSLMTYIDPRNVIRNFVATVDNLPRKTLPPQRVYKPASGSFGTAIGGNGLVMSETNALRYAAHVKLIEKANVEALVALYARYYPLFQQAYRDLGYPNGYFNDRLVEAIDSLLATPEVKGPIKVVQPKIFYEFADPALEQLPAGQKLMLRIGRDHAEIVRKRLREIRALVTAVSPAEITADLRRN